MTEILLLEIYINIAINRHVLLTDFLFSSNFYFVYFHFSIFYSTCSSCVWQLQLQKWNEM